MATTEHVGQGRYSLVDHTGELSLRIEAPTPAALFAAAARALAEVMAGDAGGDRDDDGAGGDDREAAAAHEGPVEPEVVALDAPDRDALLVDWLNELIWRAEVHRRIYDDITIDAATDTTLRATLRGRAVAELRSPVKAATLHGLHVAAAPDGGVTVTVVLDV